MTIFPLALRGPREAHTSQAVAIILSAPLELVPVDSGTDARPRPVPDSVAVTTSVSECTD